MKEVSSCLTWFTASQVKLWWELRERRAMKADFGQIRVMAVQPASGSGNKNQTIFGEKVKISSYGGWWHRQFSASSSRASPQFCLLRPVNR